MKSKYLALFLGWLLPGLGHFYAGKRQKAVVFFTAITVSSVAGLALGEFRNVYFQVKHYQFYAEIGNGLFTLIASAIMGLAAAAPIESTARSSELAGIIPIADLYVMIAGLLNLIVAANGFDIVAGEKKGTI